MYLWWMDQPWFHKPWSEQLHWQLVLPDFAGSRSLCSRKSAGLKEPQCCWDTSSNAAFHRHHRTDLHKIYKYSLCQVRGWAPVIYHKKCVAVPRPACAFSAPPLGVFSPRCPINGLQKMKSFKNLRGLLFPAGVIWWILDRAERVSPFGFGSWARIAWSPTWIEDLGWGLDHDGAAAHTCFGARRGHWEGWWASLEAWLAPLQSFFSLKNYQRECWPGKGW